VDPGEGMQDSKNIQEPQNYRDDHNGVQDRLNRARHRYEAVDEPEENTHHDQGHQNLH